MRYPQTHRLTGGLACCAAGYSPSPACQGEIPTQRRTTARWNASGHRRLRAQLPGDFLLVVGPRARGIEPAQAGDNLLVPLRGLATTTKPRHAGRIHDAPQWEALLGRAVHGRLVPPARTRGHAVECKRLTGVSRSRVRTDIRDANRQIKRAAAELDSPYSGIVVLDVSAAVGFAEGSSEEAPAAVREIERAAAAAMSGAKNRSVREALIVWRYYRLQRAPDISG